MNSNPFGRCVVSTWPAPDGPRKSGVHPLDMPGRFAGSSVRRDMDGWRWEIRFTNARTSGWCRDLYSARYAVDGIKLAWTELTRMSLNYGPWRKL